MDKMLSVVLPAYNEEQMIKKTAQVVGDLLEKEQIPYELVFVNDGSKAVSYTHLTLPTN